jgi:hypothetical protein
MDPGAGHLRGIRQIDRTSPLQGFKGLFLTQPPDASCARADPPPAQTFPATEPGAGTEGGAASGDANLPTLNAAVGAGRPASVHGRHPLLRRSSSAAAASGVSGPVVAPFAATPTGRRIYGDLAPFLVTE